MMQEEGLVLSYMSKTEEDAVVKKQKQKMELIPDKTA